MRARPGHFRADNSCPQFRKFPMTSLSAPRSGFRLSHLLYDSRYRSRTIQIVALILVLVAVGWLISNAASNLAISGKSLSFSFLGDPAGYEINQRLIEYGPRDTHLRAAMVGLFNTLLVSVLGCITATVIGTFIGVMRLSTNVLISRLMAVYVEMFRNVPLLLWIVLIMAVLSEIMPPPSAFRGADAAASMSFWGHVAVTNRGIYLPAPVFAHSLGYASFFGGVISLNLNVVAVLCVLAASLLTARLIRQRADRVQQATGVRPPTALLRLAVWGVPIAALLALLGLYFDVPYLKGFNFRGGLHLRNSLLALWWALSLYTAAFIAEIVRGGILAVSQGQSEAAAALGLGKGQTMRLVILPQALRVIIPPLISQFLSLTKNSSLAIAVGYMEITGTLMGISLNQTGRELESVLLGMGIYLLISLSISAVMNWYNKRVKLVER